MRHAARVFAETWISLLASRKMGVHSQANLAPREAGKFPGSGPIRGGKTGYHPLGGGGGIVDDEAHAPPGQLNPAEGLRREGGQWEKQLVSAFRPLTVDQQRGAK